MRSPALTLARLVLASSSVVLVFVATAVPAAPDEDAKEPHRSPIALAVSSDGGRILTANQTAGTVSVVDVASGKVVAEIATGDKPSGVAIEGDSLHVTGRVEVGPEPRGVALSGDRATAYVAVGASNELVRVDLEEKR